MLMETGETDLNTLLKTVKPQRHEGQYVFCVIPDWKSINLNEVVMLFKEEEGQTIIIRKELADHFHLNYTFIATWITLSVHSSLEAVGLTAVFSRALAEKGISCNVVAAFYHDPIFVDQKDADDAMQVLALLSQ